jgi:hypothetical protein
MHFWRVLEPPSPFPRRAGACLPRRDVCRGALYCDRAGHAYPPDGGGIYADAAQKPRAAEVVLTESEQYRRSRSADQEILRAMSGAMRQIEDELTEGHEVLTREPAPVLIGSRWLLRAGSGAG